MNREHIVKLAERIRTARYFNMTQKWRGNIANHAVAAFGEREQLELRALQHGSWEGAMFSYARELLDLDCVRASALFTPYFGGVRHDAITRSCTAEVLLHLAETGCIRWDKFWHLSNPHDRVSACMGI